MSTYERLYLALTAIRLRVNGKVNEELRADVQQIVDDALDGLVLDAPPEGRDSHHFDIVHVDGAAFEVEVRAASSDKLAPTVHESPHVKKKDVPR